jgi:integrase
LVLWPDYELALHLLLDDKTAGLRERQLQACVLLLMFRFGLRISEALGLRARDLHREPDGIWVVIVRPTDYRELKTDSGIRQVPLIGPLSETEATLLESWAQHAQELVGDDRCGALFSRHDCVRHLVDRSRIVARITDALRAATGNPVLRPHHLRHSFATRTVGLVSLDAVPAEPALAAIVRRLVGPCEPAATRRLLLDRPERSKRGLWALSTAIGHASPRTTLRWYSHAQEFLAALQLVPLFESARLRLDAATASYVLGVRLPASQRKVDIDEALIGRHQRSAIQRVASMVRKPSGTPVLPARRVVPQAPVGPLDVDRLLDITYRRGRVDGIERILMVPATGVERQLRADFDAREQAGYDVPRAAWAPTSASHAVSHARAGARAAHETARVRVFLRQLAPRLSDASWVKATSQVAELWRSRYRADTTALVLASVAEMRAMAQWCTTSGLQIDQLMVVLPTDSRDTTQSELGPLTVDGEPLTHQVGVLPKLRARYRRQGQMRLGFQLRENDQGPLTQMTQWHRVMHVLSVWLEVHADPVPSDVNEVEPLIAKVASRRLPPPQARNTKEVP